MNAKVMLSISMAIFGTLGLFTRNIMVSSGELALYGALLAMLLILIHLFITKFIKNVTGFHRTLLQFFAAIIILIPYVIYTEGSHLDKLNQLGWICLLIVGLIHTGITYCMYFSALKELKEQEVAILSYIDP